MTNVLAESTHNEWLPRPFAGERELGASGWCSG